MRPFYTSPIAVKTIRRLPQQKLFRSRRFVRPRDDIAHVDARRQADASHRHDSPVPGQIVIAALAVDEGEHHPIRKDLRPGGRPLSGGCAAGGVPIGWVG
jgi:hypothetical protein